MRPKKPEATKEEDLFDSLRTPPFPA